MHFENVTPQLAARLVLQENHKKNYWLRFKVVYFYFFHFRRTLVLFVGSLIPAFWTSFGLVSHVGNVVFVVSGNSKCWLVEQLCVWKSCILIASVACGICYVWKSYIVIGWVPFFSSQWQHFCCPCILIGWVVCSGLEKKETSIFQMASNSFVILEINL